MIGAGAIALGVGIFGYSIGSTFALLYAILAILFNWWVLMADEDGQRSVIGFQSTSWQFVLTPFAGAMALEFAFA